MKTKSLIICVAAFSLQIWNVFSSDIDGTVTVDCGYSDEAALITYVGDPFAVVVMDKNGDWQFFDEDSSSATFTRIVYFNESSSGDEIAFKKKEGMELYSIHIMSRKTYKDFETRGDEEFIVECSFENVVNNVRGNVSVSAIEYAGESSLAPFHEQGDEGIKSQSTITLGIARIDGKLFTGKVKLGRLVKLKAVMTPAGNDVGFRVSSCFARSEDGTRQSTILSVGCGTPGSPFKIDQGFTVKGLVGYSPLFRMFPMKAGQTVLFYCDYTMCQTNCDEDNSCDYATGKVKRSASDSVTLTNATNIQKNNQDISNSNQKQPRGTVKTTK